jgi:flagellar hook-associated protein 2
LSSFATQSISGLASGLDTASIISALMQIDKQPQVRIQQKIVVEQARQQALQGVLTQLKSLQTSYKALTDPGTWADVQTVTSSDDAHVSASRTGGAAAGAYEVAVTQLARANQFTGSGVSAAAADDVIHIQITGAASPVDVSIAAGDTLDTIADKITGTTNSPVYASVLNGQLVLSNKSTGTAARIASVTTDGGSGLSFAETQTARDAAFTIDGASYTRSSNVVTDVLAGITFALKGQTASPASITVGTPAPDTNGIQTKLQAFITQYNTTLDYVLGKLDEQAVANPATDADRAKGVLNGDAGLESLVSSLRNSFSDLVGGRPASLQSLAQVGLSTGAATGGGPLSSDSIDGKLTLDTTRFSTQLQAHFDEVKALFTNVTGSYASEGLAQRLGGILTPWTASSASNGLLSSRIDGETRTITDLQGQSKDWDQRLALRQQMLQAQFTAMETALSQAQSQSGWLDSQMKSLGG